MEPLPLYFIINPRSAASRTKKVWEQTLLPLLKTKQIAFDYIYTEKSGHGIELARNACLTKKYSTIVAMGGDGTIHEVANGLLTDMGEPIDPAIKFGVLCSGTGSDFIKTIQVPRDPVAALEIILGGKTQTVDILKGTFTKLDGSGMGQRFSINIVDSGVSGDIVKRVNESSKILGGKATFLLISAMKMLSHKPYKARLTVDADPPLETNINVVYMGNGQYNGGGMHPCAEASLDDGLMDVFLVQNMNKNQLMKKLTKIYGSAETLQQLRAGDPGLNYYKKAKTVKLESLDESRPMLLDFDGEIVGLAPLELKVLSKKIKLIVP